MEHADANVIGSTPAGVGLLSARVASMEVSPTIAMSQRAAALRAQGVDVISMSLGEPDFNTPARIVEAAYAAAQAGFTRYTAADGAPVIKNAVRQKLLRDNHLEYAPAEIHVASGAKQVIHNAFAATLDPGDEVIVFTPCWVSYMDVVVFCGGVPVKVATTPASGFLPDAASLRAAITPRTKWVLLNSPGNPTGAVYPASLLRELAEVLADFPRVLVMADEIYEHLVFEPARHVSILEVAPQLRDRVLLVNGVSKTYSMTGWRIGFAAGPAWLIDAMGAVQSQTAGNSCSVAQAAAAEALTGDQSEVATWVRKFHSRRDRALAVLGTSRRISVTCPAGAFYLYADVGACIGARTPEGGVLRDDTAVVEYLLVEARVATIPGVAFAMSPFVRLSFALDEERVAEACRRIVAALDRLALASGAGA
jgi:aspartate aminotransferase